VRARIKGKFDSSPAPNTNTTETGKRREEMEERYALMKMPIEAIGTALANSGDDEQAKLINVFGKELGILCRSNLEPQICAISRLLDKDGKHLVNELAAFIALRTK
jgi:hypothetical protein